MRYLAYYEPVNESGLPRLVILSEEAAKACTRAAHPDLEEEYLLDAFIVVHWVTFVNTDARIGSILPKGYRDPPPPPRLPPLPLPPPSEPPMDQVDQTHYAKACDCPCLPYESKVSFLTEKTPEGYRLTATFWPTARPMCLECGKPWEACL